jgi:type II secretion system protein G
MIRRQRGFTLLELLLVVAIIAIIAAIATMSYLLAIQRAREKKTMNDIRTIATAWESRAADANVFTPAGFVFPSTTIEYDDLNAALAPTYTRDLPKFDAWGKPYEFGTAGPKDYAIRSAGRDGLFDGTYEDGPTNEPDCDIVYANGAFLVWPDSALKK